MVVSNHLKSILLVKMGIFSKWGEQTCIRSLKPSSLGCETRWHQMDAKSNTELRFNKIYAFLCVRCVGHRHFSGISGPGCHIFSNPKPSKDCTRMKYKLQFNHIMFSHLSLGGVKKLHDPNPPKKFQQDGLQPIINRIITPIGLKPQLPIYFRPFIGVPYPNL